MGCSKIHQRQHKDPSCDHQPLDQVLNEATWTVCGQKKHSPKSTMWQRYDISITAGKLIKKKKKVQKSRTAQASSVSVLYGSESVIQYQEPSFLNMTQGAGIGVYTVILGKESLISTAHHLHMCLDVIIGRCM